MPTTPSDPIGVSGLTEVLAPVIEREGLVLEAIESPGGEPPVLRVIIDRAEGTEGVGLDTIAEISELIGAALDAGPLAGDTPYDLEVTSPGATRPLTLPRHWSRQVGRMVQIKQTEGEDLGGLLLAADAEGIELEPIKPPAKKGMKAKVLPQVRIPFASIRRGKVDVEATAARLLADPTAGYAETSNEDTSEEA